MIFLLSILSLGIISSSSHAYAQQHALELKATQQGAEVEEESGAEVEEESGAEE